MYGTCETLCRELAVKYPGDMPLMLVIWSPEEIQALADGMDISLSDPEIRTVLARLEDIPEDQRIESGISSAAAMEIISNVSENRQVTVPAELLASLIQTAEQALWKREWAARDNGLAVTPVTCCWRRAGRKRRMSTSVTRSIRAGSAFMFCWMRPGWRRYSLTATAAYCRRTWPPPFRN